jgi:hypothetical protein
MKCRYSAFNAQGSRLIIVAVQLQVVKIYVAAVEALRKKERQDETQFTTKVDGFLSFTPPLNANVLFCRFVFTLTLCLTKLRVLCFSYSTDNSISLRVISLCRNFSPHHISRRQPCMTWSSMPFSFLHTRKCGCSSISQIFSMEFQN